MAPIFDSLNITKQSSFLASIIENFDAAVIGKSLNGEILSWNMGAEKLYGWRADEIIGKDISILIPSEQKDEKKQFLAKISRGEKIESYQTTRIHKDGTPIQISLNISPIQNESGALIGSSSVSRPIQSHKETEKKLEKLAGFQETILRDALTSIIATDTEGTITLFNHAAEKLLGYTADEMVGRLTPAVFHDPAEVEIRARELSELYNTVIEPGFDVFIYKTRLGQPESREWTYIRKDGSRFPVWLSVSALKDSKGEIFGYLGVASDLTERKREEIKNHRTKQQLEQLNRIQQKFNHVSERSKLFSELLNILLSGSNSEYGFIGEILSTADNQPYLKTTSITNISWNEETKKLYESQAQHGFEFYNLNTLFGEVIVTGQTLIANDPANHPKASGIPEGHPPLNSFLGIPLNIEGSMVGMVGLANRPSGYDEEILEFLQPLLVAASNLIQVHRSETKRARIEEDIRQSESRLRAVVNNTIDGIITIDAKGIVQEFNPAAERIFGYAASEVIGKNVKMLMPESYAREHDTYIQNYLTTQKAKIIGIGREVEGKRKNGTLFPLELGISVMGTEETLSFVGITRDITDQKIAEKAREQLASIVENTEDAIWGLDLDGTVTFWNNAAKKIFGYSEIEIVGKNISSLVPEDRKSEPDYVMEKIKRGETLNSFSTQRRRKDGKYIHVSLTVSPIYGEKKNIVGSSTIARDISDQVALLSEKEKLIEKLEESNLRDPLTDLLNRRGMMQRLEYEKSRYRRFGNTFSLILIDIDHFKKVNDTYGHQTGDEALLFLTRVLRESSREQDSICRWGGEEFLILLPHTDKQGAQQFADKLLDSIREQSFESGDNTISMTASMGLITARHQDESLEHLLNPADELLYVAKENGRDRVVADFPSTG